MDSSSPNNKTIDTKEEKWKLLLGEACHDVLAGSAPGPNPAAAGLGLSTPQQPAGRARLASPVWSCLLVHRPPSQFHLQLSLQRPADAHSVFMLLTHPRAGGMRRDEQKRQRTAWRWAWEGDFKSLTVGSSSERAPLP